MTQIDSVLTVESADELADARAENRDELVSKFVDTNPDYYREQFQKIGSTAKFSWTFNWVAALLGPIWFGMRSIWKWALPFTILETFGVIQLARGLFGDLGADARDRIGQIQGTLNFRYEQLEAAEKNNAANVDVFKRAITSLEKAIADIQAEVVTAEANAFTIALFGLGFLAVVKLIEGIVANPALENRFSEWLSNRSLRSGLSPWRTAISVGFVFLIFAASVIHYAFPGAVGWLAEFPTDQVIRRTGIEWVESFFNFIKTQGQQLFESISYGIRVVLDALEVLFVKTPWPVIASFIILLTWLSAGVGGAIAAACFLLYMGLFGFWEKAMTTLALLGTAACISTARPLLRPPPTRLRDHPTNHGLHADDAVVRIHDPRDRILQRRQTCCGHHHDDLRRHACRAANRPRNARCTGVNPRSRHRVWRVQVVPADESRPPPRRSLNPRGSQSNDHAQPCDGRGRLADRRKRFGRRCTGSAAILICRTRHLGRLCDLVLCDDLEPSHSRQAGLNLSAPLQSRVAVSRRNRPAQWGRCACRSRGLHR